MARPIRPTPPVKGKDAKKFREEIRRNENHRVSHEDLQRMNENYRHIKSLELSEPTRRK